MNHFHVTKTSENSRWESWHKQEIAYKLPFEWVIAAVTVVRGGGDVAMMPFTDRSLNVLANTGIRCCLVVLLGTMSYPIGLEIRVSVTSKQGRFFRYQI